MMEAMLEAAKRFQELEERSAAQQASFQQMQQQYQQMHENASQLQSLAEERLAALSALNVELKARHAQGEQTLNEVRALLDEAKACQSRIDQAVAAADSRQQVDAERAAQVAHTLGVVQTLMEKLQTRQAQLEQSLLAMETLVKDQGKRNGDTTELMQRQEQLEKALAAFDATQQAEKGLMAHFEKTLAAVKTRVAELEKRPAGNGESAPVAVNELLAKVEEIRQILDQGAEQAAKALELSAQALEKAATAASSQPAAAVVPGEGQQQLEEEFRKFLARCDEDYKAALERENKLAAQWRKALDSLPSRAEGAIQKFLEQTQSRMDQSFLSWLKQREERVAEREGRDEDLLQKIIERQQALEGQIEKLPKAAEAAAAPPEWMQAIQASNATHTNEIRFLKTLLWITLAAVGLSYGLVAYAVILRSS